MKGKWRIVEMPDYTDDFPDMMEPAYILFDGKGAVSSPSATSQALSTGPARPTGAVEFAWDGNDEMDEACGDGWAELQPDGSIKGQICFQRGDEAGFTARPWQTSSTTC